MIFLSAALWKMVPLHRFYSTLRNNIVVPTEELFSIQFIADLRGTSIAWSTHMDTHEFFK